MSHASFLLTVLFLVLCATRPMYAGAPDTSCGIIWDEPILLSDTNYNAYSPEIALSGEDTVHIVWSSSTGATRLPYVRSVDGGSSFGPRVELLSDSLAFTGRANRPSVVAWHSNVYVFFQGPASDTPIRMVKSTTGGETWQYPVDISPDTTGPPPLTPTILGDTIVMTYEPRGEPLPWILRSTDAGVTWENVSSGVRIFHRLALGPRVTPSAGSVLHLVHNVQPGSSIETEYRRSTDLGDTWIQQEIISDIDGLESSIPTIGASDNGSILTAWREAKFGCLTWVGCGVAGRLSLDAGATFGNETRFDMQASGYDATIAARGNNLAVAWADDLDGHIKLRASYTAGATWCEPMNASHVGGGRPQVALSQTAVHVVWASGNGEPGNRSRIFYRRGHFKTTDVRDNSKRIPRLALLKQNFPNPFNPSTEIVYSVRSQESVSLKIYDLLGREVVTLVNGKKELGEHTVEWNAEGLPSGMYYYRLTTADGIETRKAVLIK